MVSGCHPGDCHYLTGNYHARRRFVILKKLLTIAGFEPDRIHFTWVSASEGIQFAGVVREITKKVTALKPNPFKFPSPYAAEPPSITNSVHPASILPSGFGDDSKYFTMQHEIRQICKKLLEDGTVDIIIGFIKSEDTEMLSTCFIDAVIGSDELVMNNRCIPNLSGYLLNKKGKTAIVAKPCDSRAIVSLIQECQLKRDNVYIIGTTCFGMFNSLNEPLPCCIDCRSKMPSDYDILVGEPQNSSHDPVSDVSPTVDESFDRFLGEMNKCILCFSCRQSCYGCYCKTCFIDRGEPDWQTSSPDLGTKMLYHLGRATHLSGRCVECGACENTCASGVDIRYLIHAVTRFIEDTYDYRAGMDPEAEPVMLTYKADDLEIGFLGFPDNENTDTAGGCANV